MITIDQMVQREVNCCLSSLVATLANGYGASMGLGQPAKELADLCEQAYDLASPVPDYEEAATQDGWKFDGTKWTNPQHEGEYDSPDEMYGDGVVEPYEWEVYEHWAVSTWLAERLLSQGEKVDTDFAGMNVWARTTTGQGIANDSCIEKIYAELIR